MKAGKTSISGTRMSFGDGNDNIESLYINQESDIILIIDGMRCIINTCLDIKSDGQVIEEEPNDDDLNEEEQARIGKLAKTDGTKK